MEHPHWIEATLALGNGEVNGEWRVLDGSRQFTPWRTGLYWALACDARTKVR